MVHSSMQVSPASRTSPLLLERRNQRRHGEEVIAADVQHELQTG
jgi:hypothetical protein